MNYFNTKVMPTTRVAKGATVIGDVSLGEDCTVFFGAVLRADMGGKIYVGDRTNIQDLVCVHVPLNNDTVIGKEVSVGHGAIIHGCTIGDNTLVGMGAIILDGARIGKHCLVGAGALVTGTADIPDGMLVVGSPAKAVRKLRPDEIDGLAINVREYIQAGKDLVENGLALEGAIPQL